jgi:5-methylcytosine-specific restriction endonuclease McrA
VTATFEVLSSNERGPRRMPSMRDIVAFHGLESAFCVRCGRVDDLERAHLIDRCFAGLDGPQNLAPLCWYCHRRRQPIFVPGQEDLARAWFRLPPLDAVPVPRPPIPRPPRSPFTGCGAWPDGIPPGRQVCWERARRVVLERDGDRCRRCGARSRHVWHLSPGDAVLDNLAVLCVPCGWAHRAVPRLALYAPDPDRTHALRRRLVRLDRRLADVRRCAEALRYAEDWRALDRLRSDTDGLYYRALGLRNLIAVLEAGLGWTLPSTYTTTRRTTP